MFFEGLAGFRGLGSGFSEFEGHSVWVCVCVCLCMCVCVCVCVRVRLLQGMHGR